MTARGGHETNASTRPAKRGERGVETSEARHVRGMATDAVEEWKEGVESNSTGCAETDSTRAVLAFQRCVECGIPEGDCMPLPASSDPRPATPLLWSSRIQLIHHKSAFKHRSNRVLKHAAGQRGGEDGQAGGEGAAGS